MPYRYSLLPVSKESDMPFSGIAWGSRGVVSQGAKFLGAHRAPRLFPQLLLYPSQQSDLPGSARPTSAASVDLNRLHGPTLVASLATPHSTHMLHGST